MPREVRRPERTSGHAVREYDSEGAGTILVADDEEGVRSLVASVLEDAGYLVEIAETAGRWWNGCATWAIRYVWCCSI